MWSHMKCSLLNFCLFVLLRFWRLSPFFQEPSHRCPPRTLLQHGLRSCFASTWWNCDVIISYDSTSWKVGMYHQSLSSTQLGIASQSINQPTNQSTNQISSNQFQPINQPTNHSTNQISSNQFQPINQPTNQPIKSVRSIPTNQPTNQPINQSNQFQSIPTNQPTNQPINRWTNEPINQINSSQFFFPLALFCTHHPNGENKNPNPVCSGSFRSFRTRGKKIGGFVTTDGPTGEQLEDGLPVGCK